MKAGWMGTCGRGVLGGETVGKLSGVNCTCTHQRNLRRITASEVRKNNHRARICLGRSYTPNHRDNLEYDSPSELLLIHFLRSLQGTESRHDHMQQPLI